MPRVKILLGPISPEWRSLLIKLADSDDELEIVGATEDFVDLLVEVEKLKADVVVLSQLRLLEVGQEGVRRIPGQGFKENIV